MRSQIPALKASGGGFNVNIAAVLGQLGLRKSAAYVAAKHGVVELERSARVRTGQRDRRLRLAQRAVFDDVAHDDAGSRFA